MPFGVEIVHGLVDEYVYVPSAAELEAPLTTTFRFFKAMLEADTLFMEIVHTLPDWLSVIPTLCAVPGEWVKPLTIT